MKLPSKRLVVRLSVLSVVVAVGGFAIAQAHLALKKSDQGDPRRPGDGEDAASTPFQQDVQAIPDTQNIAQEPGRSDPFQGSRLLQVSHAEEDTAASGLHPVSDAAYRDTRFQAQGNGPGRAPLSTAVADAAISDTPSPAAPPASSPAGGGLPRDTRYEMSPPSASGPPTSPTDVPPAALADAGRPGAFRGENVLRSPSTPTPDPHGGNLADANSTTTDPNAQYALPYGSAQRSLPGTTAPPADNPGDDVPRRDWPTADAASPPDDSPYRTATVPRPGYDLSSDVPGAIGSLQPEAGVPNDSRIPESDRFAAAGALPSEQGNGTPGEQTLEGPQTPSIVMAKSAPSEIQVGKPARFNTQIRNVGQATATKVIVHDQVPKGTRLIDTTPPAARINGSDVYWELDSLEPNEEKTVSMQVMPAEEGEVGSVATVTFSAQASVRTVSTRPELVLEHTGPRKVLVGSPVAFTIKLSNPGTGAATGVTLEENVPEGLSHPAGSELEFEVGTLRPGETRELELTLTANKAGIVENVLVVRADAGLEQRDVSNIEVVAPELKIAMDGPRRRYLERPATYEIAIMNPGTAAAKEVEMVAYLPKGIRFAKTNNAGSYDADRHAVYWSVAELPVEGKGSVQLTLLPMEDGEQTIKVEARAGMGLVDLIEHTVLVEGLASLYFEVTDLADPIEVGEETLYEVRVLNEGSKTSETVQVVAVLPPGLKPLSGEGPTRGVLNGQQVSFQPLERLAPKADAMYKIRVQGAAPGHHRIRVQVFSAEMQEPVTREESTRVYSDQ